MSVLSFSFFTPSGCRWAKSLS